MKSAHRILWAGVEFQPDLQNPKKPVRLGVILLKASASGEISVLILGRQPVVDRRPPEFENVESMTLELAASWVEHMAKDLLEAEASEPFARLAERWRWNLYLIQPARIIHKEQQNLMTLAKKTYERFVGERFGARSPARTPRRAARHHQRIKPPGELPAAWLVEEITRRRFSPEYVASV